MKLVSLALIISLFSSWAFTQDQVVRVKIYNSIPQKLTSSNLAKRLDKASRPFKKFCNLEFIFEIKQSNLIEGNYQQLACSEEVSLNKGHLSIFYGDKYENLGWPSCAFSYPVWRMNEILVTGTFGSAAPLQNTAWLNFDDVRFQEKKVYPFKYSVEAHELGHLLGLEHVTEKNLMSDDVTKLSGEISLEQCEKIKKYIKEYFVN